jgi:hemoglobin
MAAVCGLALLVAHPVSAQETLYKRLGGYDAISAVVDDFADRLFADPVVGKRFVGMGSDTRALFKQKNKNLVCSVTGGPCLVISRPARVVHAGMGISEGEFQIVVGHLVAVLNKYKVPDREQKELLGIIGSLKPDIVESH